jgi:hypothetical protein
MKGALRKLINKSHLLPLMSWLSEFDLHN